LLKYNIILISGKLRLISLPYSGLAKSNPTIICPPLTKYDSVGEDDVFMTLDLPVESESLQKIHSSPEGSEKSHSKYCLVVYKASGIDLKGAFCRKDVHI